MKRSGAPAPVLAFYALAALWLLAHELQVTVAPWIPAGPTRYAHVPWLLGCAALAARGALRRDRDRAAWLCFAAGILSWTLGEVALNVLIAGGGEIPVPSVADAGYLGALVLWFAGVLLRVLRQQRGRTRAVLIDGLTCALTVAATGAAIVFPRLAVALDGDPLGVATNLAYPLGDLATLGVVGLMLALRGWRLDRTLACLAGGFVLFSVTDSRYLIVVAEGTYVQGGWTDAGWWVGMALISFAAWIPAPGRRSVPSTGMLAAIPGAFSIAAVMILVHAGFTNVSGVAVVLAGAALVSGTLRMVLTIRENAATLRATHREAQTDALTGLGNRRRLLDDLAERAENGLPYVLAVFDLNGFKRFNDAFGHPAGDALLARLGRALRTACGDTSTAYRLGGDEFCALLPDGPEADAAVLALAGALSESGPGYAVTTAIGTVGVPEGARTPEEAIATADARMYEAKRARRSAAVGTLTLGPLAGRSAAVPAPEPAPRLGG